MGCGERPGTSAQRSPFFSSAPTPVSMRKSGSVYNTGRISLVSIWIATCSPQSPASGSMIRSTEAAAMAVTAYAPLVIVYNNTEFERGHALETFTFRVDSAEPQLERYFFNLASGCGVR